MAKLGEALEAADKDFISWLFREMRAQRVTGLKFKGLEVNLHPQALLDPTRAELEAQAKFLSAPRPEEPVRPDTMPPELAGPLAAAAIMSGQAPPPWMRNVEGQAATGRAWTDPTDPERDIDDNELLGADLPQEQ